ncbi:putative ABC transporter permease subunit [Clostridium cochlearium]|jgi:ABC-2 type transport system permease protein|uniref:putative ABC transporter permease subunit n=1 Tax=Clostridium cochlearium TaxID=1494 RepID=UPI00241FBEFE|nr:transporter [Clostridium cochlearium]MBE6066050.1 transporter [Clostridium cochlearium]
MSRFISLTKVFIKTNLGIYNKEDKKKAIVLVILLALGFMPLLKSLSASTSNIYDILKQINEESIILYMGIAATSLAIFIFAIFHVMNTFYFSMDIENLIPLPLRSYEIIGSKLILIIIYEYITEIIFLLPVLIQYGIKINAGLVYYIYGAIIFLINPIVPTILCTILIMVIMRFSNLGKNKDRFKMISGVVALSIGIGINLFIQSITSRNQSKDQIENMIMTIKGKYVGVLSKIFPTTKSGVYSLIEHNNFKGFIYICLFLIITLLFLVAFIYIGEKLYLKGVVGISETTSTRKAIEDADLHRYTKKRSVITSYVLKEIKVLLRTPIYFMNCILMNFLWPVFFIAPIAMQGELSEIIQEVNAILQDIDGIKFVVIIAFSVVLFITATNGIAASSISREGQNLYFNKFVPLDVKNMFMAKIVTAVIIEFVSISFILLIISLIIKVPLIVIISILIITIPAMFFSSLMGLIIDLYYPKLNWDNEQKAVKQNFNIIGNMALNTILAVITATLFIKLNLNLITTILLIIAIYTLINILMYIFLKNKGVAIFNNIEN